MKNRLLVWTSVSPVRKIWMASSHQLLPCKLLDSPLLKETLGEAIIHKKVRASGDILRKQFVSKNVVPDLEMLLP